MKALPNHVGFDAPFVPLAENQIKKSAGLKALQSLAPFVVDGVLRVGGRLQRAPISDAAKHPILLPSKHPITKLIILQHHVKKGHMGVSQTLSSINKNYWIPKGKSTVKKVLRSCFNCIFWRAKIGKQQMGELPAHRDTPNPPFSASGTDLMGPLYVRIGRNNVKRWVCIFNCLSTRAVHFEVVQSLDTSAFIQAFRRFCNRRISRVRHIYSDNAGNFTKANRELNQCIELWRSKNFQDAMLKEEISWHFGPPLASHQNGFTEAFFQIVRKIFRSIIGEATLDEFDLMTLLTEVERILNDRPLTELPSAPSDLPAITPSMILTGSLGDGTAPGFFMKGDAYRRSWRKTQYLADRFWDRWLAEYLPLLQTRHKWYGTSPNFKVGDLVLVVDESTKRGLWPKGVIEAVMPDTNNLVRQVKVRTAHSNLVRDVRKLCLLEGFEE